MSSAQHDNDTLDEKLQWRREALYHHGPDPIICDAYGGWGVIGRALYRDVAQGMVCERDMPQAQLLSADRPTWSVYRGDTPRMLQAGAGRHLPFSFVDLDPYGSPLPALRALFTSERPLADRVVVVAHDGTYRSIQMGKAWTIAELELVVAAYGNSFVKDHYDGITAELLGMYGRHTGHTLQHFAFAPGGDRKKQAHWMGVLER